MNIYLVRHGQYDQATGHLTPAGIEEVKLLKNLLDFEKITFDLVMTSPKDRTKETAELLAGGARTTLHHELSPSSNPHVAAAIIPRDRNILIVSHNPLLSGLADIFGEEVFFEPATMAIFDLTGLKKVITPK